MINSSKEATEGHQLVGKEQEKEPEEKKEPKAAFSFRFTTPSFQLSATASNVFALIVYVLRARIVFIMLFTIITFFRFVVTAFIKKRLYNLLAL